MSIEEKKMITSKKKRFLERTATLSGSGHWKGREQLENLSNDALASGSKQAASVTCSFSPSWDEG